MLSCLFTFLDLFVTVFTYAEKSKFAYPKIGNFGIQVLSNSLQSKFIICLAKTCFTNIPFSTLYFEWEFKYNINFVHFRGTDKLCILRNQIWLYHIYLLTMYAYCVFCYVKKSKTTAKLSENSWNKCHFNHFQWCPLWSQSLYSYPFLPSLYMNQVSEFKLHFLYIFVSNGI